MICLVLRFISHYRDFNTTTKSLPLLCIKAHMVLGFAEVVEFLPLNLNMKHFASPDAKLKTLFGDSVIVS
ncbi:MAG: hypothetical protein RBR78_11305 [Flavobacteriaceae bacterium]|nr:hypothetical protein [Flavobacteriaceae bacterium]